MKKLLMTMAASVAAIGLTYAEGEGSNDGGQGEATAQPTLVELTDNFDEEEIGELFNTENPRGDYIIWTTTDAESVVVDSVTDDDGLDVYLKLETAKDAPLLRTFADYGMPPAEGAADNRTITSIENQDVIVDANITFTGFEEDPVPTEGEDKILVWMKAVDAEYDDNGLKDGTGVTNLCITAGALQDDGVASYWVDDETEKTHFYTHEINLGEDAVVGKEYRVTIKSVGNIVNPDAIPDGVLGFEVYIDGKQVKFTAEGSAFWDSYPEDNKLDNVFPALIAGTTLKAAGFEGTGTIDDVLVCAADNEEQAPRFTQGGGDEPGSEVTPNDPEAEFEGKVDTVNGNLAAYLKNPFGEGKDDLFEDYVNLFEAVPVGETGKVKIQLTGTAEGMLKEEVNNLSTNATEGIASILTALASAEGDVVQLTNIAVTPGLWYSVAAGSELDGMDEGTRKLAVSATMTLDVPVVKDDQGKKSTKAFYKVLINVTDDNPPESVE